MPAAFFLRFLPAQKSNKKGRSQSITARLGDGSLIKLLNYCGEEHLFPDGNSLLSK